MTNTNNAWLKVLEDRVTELQQKYDAHRKNIDKTIAEFREWAKESDDLDLFYDIEYRAEKVAKVRETYKAVWHELKKAEAELQNYKETMGL